MVQQRRSSNLAVVVAVVVFLGTCVLVSGFVEFATVLLGLQRPVDPVLPPWFVTQLVTGSGVVVGLIAAGLAFTLVRRRR